MRILLVRPDRIGDCVIGSVAINDLRRALPDAEIFWAVRRAVAPLFSGKDFPAQLIAFDESAGTDELAAQWRALNADAVVLLDLQPLTDAAAIRSGIPLRLGHRSAVKGALTGVSGLNKESGFMHEAECARALLRLLSGVVIAGPEPMTPCVYPVNGDEGWRNLPGAAGLSRGFIVVHPGAHGAKARVPVAVWAEVVAGIVSKTGYAVALIGEKPGPGAGELWPESVPAIDLRGKLSLDATARLLASAKLCLSRDSGPAHLAAAMGCPTVCVFLENTPAMGPVRWTPLGRAVRVVVPEATPRWYERLCFDLYRRRAVAAIRPGAILAEAEALLG